MDYFCNLLSIHLSFLHSFTFTESLSMYFFIQIQFLLSFSAFFWWIIISNLHGIQLIDYYEWLNFHLASIIHIFFRCFILCVFCSVCYLSKCKCFDRIFLFFQNKNPEIKLLLKFFLFSFLVKMINESQVKIFILHWVTPMSIWIIFVFGTKKVL